jgi:hypothetical protein
MRLVSGRRHPVELVALARSPAPLVQESSGASKPRPPRPTPHRPRHAHARAPPNAPRAVRTAIGPDSRESAAPDPGVRAC